MSQNDKILLIDSMNMYIRSFAAINTSSEAGNHTGGIFGMIQSVKYIIETFRPTMVIFCWEGKNSAKKRRKILESYKSGRTVKKSLNRTFEWSSPEEEKIAFKSELLRIKEYLSVMPFYEVEIENLEADDCIAYISNYLFKENEKIIVSSDKDYFQLINDKISIFRPVKKELVTKEIMLNEYKISPQNWIISKCLTGDDSDEVPGVILTNKFSEKRQKNIPRGMGIPTVTKAFPFLSEEKQYSIINILDFAKKNKADGNFKHYEAILEQKDLLEKNYQVMQLMTHDMNLQAIEKIKNIFTLQRPQFKPFQLRLMFAADNSYYQLKGFNEWVRIMMPLNFKESNIDSI